MYRLLVYLAIAVLGFLALLGSSLPSSSTLTSSATPSVAATSTTPAENTLATTSATSTTIEASTTTAVAPHKTLPKIPASAAAASQTPTPLAVTPIVYDQSQMDTAATNLRSALVNIVCTANAGSGLQSISGSGVFIDSKGIILTNSHVAQYFLFKDRGVSCVIRTGSPAQSAYIAAPIFISPEWVAQNAKLLEQQVAIGTGEHDIALLAVTGSTTTSPLPSSFSFMPLASAAPYTGEPVAIGSYAAQFLSSQAIVSSLYPTLVFGSVKQLFTFAVNTPDIFALGGSVAAQEGSSGGGVVDPAGNLVGVITTSTTEGDTSTRNVNALSASYIRTDYEAEMNQSLDSLLAQPTQTSIAAFAPQISGLETAIVENLGK